MRFYYHFFLIIATVGIIAVNNSPNAAPIKADSQGLNAICVNFDPINPIISTKITAHTVVII